ncbi:MAG TPA: hypothetical protein VK509_01170 [Polyangiales bacterium]|nr:hypothetical protein [Polyangiales bacterium]
MKKLAAENDASLSPEERLLRDLVQSAEPFAPSPFAKRSAYHRITRAQPARWQRVARHGTLASLLLAGTAMASVGMGVYAWLEVQSDAKVGTEREAASTRSAVLHGHASKSSAPPVPEAQKSALESPIPQPGVGLQVVDPLPRTGGASAHKRSSAAMRAKPLVVPTRDPSSLRDQAEDPSQIVEALRALRRERDPQRAQRLLDHYLALHRDGAFAEDALALAIEAASVQGDPEAHSYARRYLAQFPAGRFRALAERALARAP